MPALTSLNDIYRVRASAQNIIKRALRLIGVLASGEPLPADQLSDGLEALNDMLDSWNTEALVIWALTRNEFTLTAGTNPHEIGPGSAVLDAPRPSRIRQGQAFLVVDNRERELDIVNHDVLAEWRDSTQSGIPCQLYYESAFPLGQIWFDVKPDAARTLVLYLEQMLHQVFSDGTTTELALAPGYKEAITHNLALMLWPEYKGRIDPPAQVINAAVNSKAAIKRLNVRPVYLEIDPLLTGPGVYDIVRGDL